MFTNCRCQLYRNFPVGVYHPLFVIYFLIRGTYQDFSIRADLSRHHFNPSCTKLFGTKPRKGGGGGLSQPPMISKTVDSTNFNSGRPLEVSMRGRKLVELIV